VIKIGTKDGHVEISHADTLQMHDDKKVAVFDVRFYHSAVGFTSGRCTTAELTALRDACALALRGELPTSPAPPLPDPVATARAAMDERARRAQKVYTGLARYGLRWTSARGSDPYREDAVLQVEDLIARVFPHEDMFIWNLFQTAPSSREHDSGLEFSLRSAIIAVSEKLLENLDARAADAEHRLQPAATSTETP
jgi:hypothetical protein